MPALTFLRSVPLDDSTNSEIPEIEMKLEQVGINPNTLVHDKVRAVYEEALKNDQGIAFSPSLSSQLSSLRHGHDIDPGWVEVQKVVADIAAQCKRKCPSTRYISVPEQQHPRMSTFKDNLDEMALAVRGLMEACQRETHKPKTESFVTKGHQGESIGGLLGLVGSVGDPESGRAYVDLSALQLLYLHVTEAKPLPDGVLSIIERAIDLATGPIILADYPTILDEEGFIVCPRSQAEIEGVQHVAKTHYVLMSAGKLQDEITFDTEQAYKHDDRRGVRLRFALREIAKKHESRYVHAVIMTQPVLDKDTFDPVTGLIVRIMEPIEQPVGK